MRSGTIAFLAGILILQQLAELPSALWAIAVVLLPLFIRHPIGRLPAILVAGFAWALLRATLVLNDGLPPELEGQDLTVEGTVASVPERRGRGWRFEFDIARLVAGEQTYPSPGRVRLSWYSTPEALQPGEQWRLTVRLKRPWGFMNPGGFDYEGWLYQRRIRATGYVRAAPEAERLGRAAFRGGLDRLRQGLGEDIADALAGEPYTGIVTALAIGQRDAITSEQWETLRRTGTTHLMAISGLHIGLIAGLVFFAVRWLWARIGNMPLHLPAPKAAALAALAAAATYAALAGYAIPTQRALVMVAVVMTALLAQRYTRPSQVLALALLAVLIFDPFAVMSPGFWLSFAAVSVILVGMSGRPGRGSAWWRWGRVHVVVAIGLLPLLLVFFGRVSLVAPLANFFAVPWVSFVVVPLTLLGTVLQPLSETLGSGLLAVAHQAVALLWVGLEWIGHGSLAEWRQHPPFGWSLAFAALGAALLLAPRGFPLRWMGIVLFGPMLLSRPAALDASEFELTLLDVGQGLAAVIRTRRHTLVFDAGPRFSPTFDTGAAVVVPFLRAQGIGRVDTFVVTHADNDHSGGADSLMREVAVDTLLTGEPEAWDGESLPCTAGQRWEWDGVEFRILHPGPGHSYSRNNASCVLRVSNGGAAALLTGDIERPVERLLVEKEGRALRSEVLVVPHHGSASSSSMDFVRSVRPRYALFAVGYRNRYGFPKADVLERYQALGTQPLLSAYTGAVTLKLGKEGLALPPVAYRETARRYWHSH